MRKPATLVCKKNKRSFKMKFMYRDPQSRQRYVVLLTGGAEVQPPVSETLVRKLHPISCRRIS
jgi:hypothetical protein